MGKRINAAIIAELEEFRRQSTVAETELSKAHHRIKLLEEEVAFLCSQLRELEQQGEAVVGEWDELSTKVTGLESTIAGANTAFSEVASFLTARLQERIGGASKVGVESREQLALAAGQAVLDAQFISSLAARVQEICRIGRSDLLVANAQTMSFSDILQSLANSKATGMLRVQADGTCVDVLLDRGTVKFLNPRALRLPAAATLLTYAGSSVPRPLFEKYLARRQGRDESVLFDLVGEGIIAPGHAVDFAKKLGMDLLEECLQQPTRCRLELTEVTSFSPRFEQLDFNIPVQRFLLHLFSQVDERKVLLAELGGMESVCSAATGLTETALDQIDPRHREILDLLDGERTILEVAELAGASWFTVCRILCELKRALLITVTTSEEVESSLAGW